ncbi:MAG: RNA 2',3'-cyclic phosphodiesterase [Eubacteriales bacterium]
MRAFIGIETGSAQQELWSAATYIAQLSDGRAANKNNIHLTVKFLGEVADTRDIIRAMNIVSGSAHEFYLELDELVCMSRIKIVWCTLKGDTKSLQRLRHELEEALLDCGFERDTRQFLPHITLVRDAYKKWDMQDVKLEKKVFRVSRLVLYESLNQNGELFYIPRHIAEFGVQHGH